MKVERYIYIIIIVSLLVFSLREKSKYNNLIEEKLALEEHIQGNTKFIDSVKTQLNKKDIHISKLIQKSSVYEQQIQEIKNKAFNIIHHDDFNHIDSFFIERANIIRFNKN